ncbi:MAG TPA: hypothetical protein VHL10_03770 [Nitrososphaera sp.]|jgi:hypothetical protein|nr:hypothetical protein [Nitrososphaera sp.]
MTDHELLVDLQQRVEALEAALATGKTHHASSANIGSINYDTTPHAFMVRYANGKSGKEKFVWVLAYLAKGELDKEVPLADIEKTWNRMTAQTLLGIKFNRKYTNLAKQEGWCDSSKTGSYHLLPGWEEVWPQPEAA